MPFGLTNAPAVFQRLMQQVITPLNPSAGPDFVSVDILVFSHTLKQNIHHLKTVIENGCGVREVRIVYRAGKENKNADALSRSPVSPAPQIGIAEGEVQVASRPQITLAV